MTFGKNLKAARIASGKTMAQIAEKLGVTESLISYYEAEKRYPNIKFAASLARACGTTIEALVREERK